MEYTRGQEKVLELSESTNDSLFITGPGGTGKTWVINEVISRLQKRGRKVKKAAYTGLAAQHIGGTTLARLLGLGLAKNCGEVRDPYSTMGTIEKNLDKVTDLVVDEVSMLSGDYLEMIDELIREALGKENEPFGGIRVLYSGDFLQLPPIFTSQDASPEKAWAFQYGPFQEAQVVQLVKSMRQSRAMDVHILNQFRQGEMDFGAGLEFLELAQGNSVEDATELHTHNVVVDEINHRKLQELPGRVYHYQTGYQPARRRSSMVSHVPIGEEVTLKIGAPVIVLVNKPESGYYNGTQGKVVSCSRNAVRIEVKGKGTRRIRLHTWEVSMGESRPPGQVTGMPLKLGWAATIHKSQGMTLDRIRTDLSKCWEPGHAYVALSRASDLENVEIIKPPVKFHTNPLALAYVQSLPHVEE